MDRIVIFNFIPILWDLIFTVYENWKELKGTINSCIAYPLLSQSYINYSIIFDFFKRS